MKNDQDQFSILRTIDTDKKNTTGMPDKKWLPLIYSWGDMQSGAAESKNSFSRFDLFNVGNN